MGIFSIGLPFLLLFLESAGPVVGLLEENPFTLKSYQVTSGSMEPTIETNDKLVARKLVSVWSARENYVPKRGEVIVFKLPSDPSVVFLQRVIGLPGERIQIKNGAVYINGVEVSRERRANYISLLSNGETIEGQRFLEILPNGLSYEVLNLTDRGRLDNTKEYQVPDGHYFVLGDNRDNAVDSRMMSLVGFVPQENIEAIVGYVYYSGPSGQLTYRDVVRR